MHLSAERLTLLALGEPDPGATEHLAGCEACRAELDALTGVATLGREASGLRTLAPPPAQVWERIAAGTGLAAGAAPVRPAPRRRMALVAALAALAGVLGTLGVTALLRGGSPPVTARADLAAYGTTPAAAHGQAQVVRAADGYALTVRVADLPATPGFYEVWLIDPDNGQMVAIGILGGQSDVVLPLPSSVDLRAYRLVDVSAEPYDGNVAHSGQSLLRGTLTA